MVSPKGGVPWDLKLTVRDREAARRCRERLLEWELDHLLMTHGSTIETGAQDYVRQAFAWLG